MLRRLTALLSLCATVATAQTPETRLKDAMSAVRAKDWPTATATVAPLSAIEQDLITWHALRAGQGTAEEVMAFLGRRPDWPGLPLLRRRSEGAFAEATPRTVLAFFEGRTPETGIGALSLARAQLLTGEQGAAQAGAVLAWRTLDMTAEEHDAFLQAYGPILTPHHEARLDHLLWQGDAEAAREMLPLVPPEWQALANARLALRAQADGVDALIDAVPEALAQDPGLAYERFLWRGRKGRNADAISLLLERSTSASALGRPDIWADWRLILARWSMRNETPDRAYAAASQHFLTQGADFAQLEWLAGYIALRKLNNPHVAKDHFERFLAAVDTPISLGRAGYWLGRAYDALGNEDAAQTAYAFGAQYQTAFYGLLAAEKAGLPPDPALAGTESFPDWQDAAFTKSSVFEAALRLLAADQNALGERFLTHLAESLDRTQIGQLGLMLIEMERPHIQVMLGKRAASAGHQIIAPYFALHPMATQDLPVPHELALAIARRESEFDPGVVSPVGARGLMQVMPATAQEVSNRLALPYTRARLTAEPAYNITLGTAYLAELIDRFDANPILVAAAYNAGPSRPERWMRTNGDPRSRRVDVIDWIEAIPFTETRNYVMRVSESLPVYRARLGKDPHPVPFSQELTGATLRGE